MAHPHFFAKGQLDDYEALLEAAHKAVDHGYTVYFLPNPRAFRTADFIFEKNSVKNTSNTKAAPYMMQPLYSNGAVSVKPYSPHSAA